MPDEGPPGPDTPTPRKRLAGKPLSRFEQHISLSRAGMRSLQPATLLGPGITDRYLAQALRKPAAVLVSFPRAGRTWLRVMLAHAFERLFAVKSARPLDVDAVARSEPRIPRVIVTSGHGDPRRMTVPEVHRGSKLDWAHKHTVILLVRDPRDILVSLYFDRAARSRHFRDALPYKGTIADLLREPRGGLKSIVAYYNAWAEHTRTRNPDGPSVTLVKYEHLHEDPHLEFGRLLSFLQLSADPAFVDDMVRHASFDHVRRMEASGRLGYKPPADLISDERALVLRRGLAGGYRDFFNAQDHNFAAAALADLDPWYAYSA